MADDPTASDDTTTNDPGPSDDTTETTDPAAPAPTTSTTTAPAPASASSDQRRGVFVPRWVAILVGGLLAALVIGGAGFALGRATGDEHDDDRPAAEIPFPGGAQPGPGGGNGGNDVPFPLPRPGGGNGGGGGGEVPSPGRRVLLGVSVESASGGARVTEVVPGSPADDAGLERGDVITKVGDTAIEDAAGLVSTIQEHAGEDVTLTYERDGNEDSVDVTLGGDASGSGAATS